MLLFQCSGAVQHMGVNLTPQEARLDLVQTIAYLLAQTTALDNYEQCVPSHPPSQGAFMVDGSLLELAQMIVT